MTSSAQLSDIRETLHRLLPDLGERYGVAELGLFGSYVRGEQNSGSDLDVLVAFRENPGLFDFIALEEHLSKVLGIRVDLVMRDALKPRISPYVLRELVSI